MHAISDGQQQRSNAALRSMAAFSGCVRKTIGVNGPRPSRPRRSSLICAPTGIHFGMKTNERETHHTNGFARPLQFDVQDAGRVAREAESVMVMPCRRRRQGRSPRRKFNSSVLYSVGVGAMTRILSERSDRPPLSQRRQRQRAIAISAAAGKRHRRLDDSNWSGLRANGSP